MQRHQAEEWTMGNLQLTKMHLMIKQFCQMDIAVEYSILPQIFYSHQGSASFTKLKILTCGSEHVNMIGVDTTMNPRGCINSSSSFVSQDKERVIEIHNHEGYN